MGQRLRQYWDLRARGGGMGGGVGETGEVTGRVVVGELDEAFDPWLTADAASLDMNVEKESLDW